MAIVLPSLDPDQKFEKVVDGLIREGFRHIVIVDDGSSAERRRFFDAAADKPGCVVLTHEVNKGFEEKGQALYSYRLRFDFPTDAGSLEYLRGKEFRVEKVDFAEKYFGVTELDFDR